MGQYYRYLAIDKANKAYTADSWDYDDGAKLMEHSWIGNDYVNSCLTRIYNNPCKVAWIGDYSGEGECVYNDKADNFGQYFVRVWGSEPDAVKEKPESLITFDKENCNYYLVNHTKQTYINLADYVKENNFHYNWDNSGNLWCINPLPLLTACGNGCGGGDYFGINEDDIGYWALDEIELTEAKPDGYEEEIYYFKEG